MLCSLSQSFTINFLFERTSAKQIALWQDFEDLFFFSSIDPPPFTNAKFPISLRFDDDREGRNQTISRILMFPAEFAATKVDELPRQHTEEMNCADSSVSWPGASVLLNLNVNAGIGKAFDT